MNRATLAWIALLVAGTGCARHARVDAAVVAERLYGERLRPQSAADRDDAMRRATIFDPRVDPAERSPRFDPALPFVDCTYVEPDAHSMHGTSPKLSCRTSGGEVLRVKYGRHNREIYSQVLSSRLFMMLGVATDLDEPVRLRCHGCPDDPYRPRKGAVRRDMLLLEDAIVQRLVPGLIIEQCLRAEGKHCRERRVDQGWSYAELDRIDPRAGGASRAEIDAFRLLTVFIAHADDKDANQRLLCPLDDVAEGRCTAPRLMIGDLGSTFGRGAPHLFQFIDSTSHARFDAWSSQPIWKDPARCQAALHMRVASSDPVISEAGRALLADKLSRLSDEQIRALFEVARVDRLEEQVVEAGVARRVTVEDWVEAFRYKRARIVEQRCPR